MIKYCRRCNELFNSVSKLNRICDTCKLIIRKEATRKLKETCRVNRNILEKSREENKNE